MARTKEGRQYNYGNTFAGPRSARIYPRCSTIRSIWGLIHYLGYIPSNDSGTNPRIAYYQATGGWHPHLPPIYRVGKKSFSRCLALNIRPRSSASAHPRLRRLFFPIPVYGHGGVINQGQPIRIRRPSHTLSKTLPGLLKGHKRGGYLPALQDDPSSKLPSYIPRVSLRNCSLSLLNLFILSACFTKSDRLTLTIPGTYPHIFIY
jgi:hypothetical protein